MTEPVSQVSRTILSVQRSMELRWHREIIERWLRSSRTPAHLRQGLSALLSRVDRELQIVERAQPVEDNRPTRTNAG